MQTTQSVLGRGTHQRAYTGSQPLFSSLARLLHARTRATYTDGYTLGAGRQAGDALPTQPGALTQYLRERRPA